MTNYYLLLLLLSSFKIPIISLVPVSPLTGAEGYSPNHSFIHKRMECQLPVRYYRRPGNILSIKAALMFHNIRHYNCVQVSNMMLLTRLIYNVLILGKTK